MAYGMPMQVPFPYFYPSNNSSKLHQFASTIPPNSTTPSSSETKANTRTHQSPDNSSSPINFSSRLQNNFVVGGNNDISVTVLPQRSTPNSNGEHHIDQIDDENVEVD